MGQNAIYLKKGASVGAPASDEVALISEADGTVEKLASDGTRTALGGASASLDKKTVLVAPATSILVSGLLGDTDGEYLVDVAIINAAAANTFKFQINGADTSLKAFVGEWTLGKALRTDWFIATAAQSPQQFSVADEIHLLGRLTARSGRVRQLVWTGYLDTATDGWLFFQGEYTDTVTQITSFGLVASGNMAAGSYIRLTPINSDG